MIVLYDDFTRPVSPVFFCVISDPVVFSRSVYVPADNRTMLTGLSAGPDLAEGDHPVPFGVPDLEPEAAYNFKG